MKRKSLLFTFALSLMMAGTLMMSCTKTGPEGIAGKDGEDGADAATTCMTCHDFSDDLLAKMHQYQNSAHASAANVNRSNEGCAQCHTSQGFRTMVETGEIAAVTNPVAVNCRTCHQIHETYTPADYALRGTDAFTMELTDHTYDFGSSNQCAKCHQGRETTPFPTAGAEPVNITNMRWGPHYSTQANMFAGVGAIEIAGPLPYSNSAHTTVVEDGCVSCHMGIASGITSGGHQMNITVGTSRNLNGCVDCHTDQAVIVATLNENKAEIEGLTAELKGLLVEQGLLNETTGYIPVPQVLTQDQLSYILNYKLVYYDHSAGAHNYRYTRAILTNTIAAINAKNSI